MKLSRGKVPVGVLECACSWEMSAVEIGTELSAEMTSIYHALKALRAVGYIEPHNHPRGWHRIVKPTEAGRAALVDHAARWSR